MASNTKTPVMMLKELTAKLCRSTPEYSIIYSKEGTHQNEFHMQVIVDNITAIGLGRSKKVAKHDAAQKALEQLEAEIGMYEGMNKPGKLVIKAPGIENNSPVNAVGVLSDLCIENKISLPTFTGISEVGPPHCKEFTYQCRIASITTTATAGSKKQAKQMAAKDMMDRIVQVLPDIVAEVNDLFGDLALVDNEKAALDVYTKFNKSRPNLSIKIRNYHSNVRDIVVKNKIDEGEFNALLELPPNEENLLKLLEKLELQMAIEVLEERPIIVALKLNTETPFVVCAEGTSLEDASLSAIKKAFQYLKICSL